MPRPAVKKADIERGALELFAEHGIDGTTIRMIAHRAGVTEGALYRHHESKDALVAALFHHYFKGYALLLRESLAAHGELATRLPAMVDGFFRLYDEDPQGFIFVMTVQHRLLRDIREHEHNPVEVLMDMIREGQSSGEIAKDKDPGLYAQMLMGLVMQTAVGHRYGRVGGPLTSRAGEVAAACLRMLDSRH